MSLSHKGRERLLLDVLLVPGSLHGFGPPSLLFLTYVILKRKIKNEYTPTPWTVKQPPPLTKPKTWEDPLQETGGVGRLAAPTTKSGSVSQSSAPPSSGVMDTVWPAEAFHIWKSSAEGHSRWQSPAQGPTDALPGTPQGGGAATCSRGPLVGLPWGSGS